MVDTNHPPSNLINALDEKEREIALCQSALRSKKTETRARALKRLGELRAGLADMVAALNDYDGIVRAAAAESLGNFHVEELSSDILETLMAAMDDSNDRVCSAAIASLGRLGVEAARAEIVPFLEDRNPYIVNAAIVALGRLGPPEIGEKMIGFLDCGNPYLQSAAGYAMGILPYPPAGPVMLAKLQEMLNSGNKPNPVLFGNYIKTLGLLKVRASIPLLIEIAQSYVGARSKAVQALVEMNAEEAAPVLAHMLADPGTRIRESLINLMLATRYATAPILLRPMLMDPNVHIRRSVLAAVTELKDYPSLDTIRTMSQHDTNPYIRTAAVNSLVLFLGDAALPDLVRLALDTNSAVRKTVAEKLGSMDSIDREAREALLKLAGDPVPAVQLAAQEALLRHDEVLPDIPEIQPKAIKRLLPEELLPEAGILLAQLNKWQNGLAQQFDPGSAEDLAQIDQALTLLIYHLEREKDLITAFRT